LTKTLYGDQTAFAVIVKERKKGKKESKLPLWIAKSQEGPLQKSTSFRMCRIHLRTAPVWKIQVQNGAG
jgi:hypothetical protein